MPFQDLGSAIGLSNLFRAVLTVVNLGAGALQETTGSTAASLHMLAALLASCMLVWVLADLLLHASRRSKETETG